MAPTIRGRRREFKHSQTPIKILLPPPPPPSHPDTKVASAAAARRIDFIRASPKPKET